LAYVNSILRTPAFGEWLAALSDLKGKARILVRLTAAELGHFGDSKPVKDGVWEMRIDVGPGYRVYYCRRGKTVYLLLAGGDKASQARDIKRALKLAQEWKA
jgi:putative addiction module killer protein